MKKIFLCLIIIVIGITGCSLDVSKNIEQTIFSCNIEDENVRISKDDEYYGNLDIKTMELYENDELKSYIKDNYILSKSSKYCYDIYIDEEIKYNFVEVKDAFGRKTYEIFNEKSEFLARIEEKNDIIKIVDSDEKLIADCEITRQNQYIIKIYNYNLQKEAILIIFTIYQNINVL